MKKLLTRYLVFLVLLIPSILLSQKIHTVQYESQCDLKVFKVEYESQVKGNEGLWYFVEYSSQSDKKIFFVEYESQSDLKIYFVDYKSQSGWRDNSKKHLLY